MNEENHAQCVELASTCAGEIIQLESCPLQFSCSDAEGGGGDSTYDPCAGKSCGDSCNICAPDDADCVETAMMKYCDAAGKCVGTVPKCE